MTEKRWSWRKKLAASIFVVILLCVGGGVVCMLKLERDYRNPPVHIFPSTAELDNEPGIKERFESRFLHIPESARDIFFCMAGGKDKMRFYSFILPSKEVRKFAEEFSGVPLSQFHECDEDLTKLSSPTLVRLGPAFFAGEKWKSPYWNLTELKRCIYFEPEKKWGRKLPIVIDLDTNRVYVCVH